MKRRLLLDVVVAQSTPVFQLLTGEDQALLVWRNTLLVLNLRLHIFNRIRRFHFQRDRLTSERLDEHLHTTTQTEDEVKRRLLLNVVVAQRTAILKLLTSKDQALLVRGNALLVLNLRLDVLDRVRGLDLERDSLARQSLDEHLHTTTQTEDEVKRRLLLDVVVAQRTAILKLLASKDKALLVRGNTLLVLDLGLDVLDRVRGLDLERNRLSCQGLNENLHECLV